MPLNALTYLIHQFVCIGNFTSKVKKSFFCFEGKNATSHQGGGGQINVARWEGGVKKVWKKCHVLFEWPLKTSLYFCCLVISLSQSQSNHKVMARIIKKMFIFQQSIWFLNVHIYLPIFILCVFLVNYIISDNLTVTGGIN